MRWNYKVEPRVAVLLGCILHMYDPEDDYWLSMLASCMYIAFKGLEKDGRRKKFDSARSDATL